MFSLSATFDLNNPYIFIISLSLIIILSSVFNFIAKRTNIPSVLLLIILGIGIQLLINQLKLGEFNLMSGLEILGIIGLIMIVLEAALDLELTKEKYGIIAKSLLVALISLLGSAFLIAAIFNQLLGIEYMQALFYATPLSIMSSAIIIPSVGGLIEKKKEFMIYEGTFSDVIGIMFFYFLISLMESGGEQAAFQFGWSLLLTIIIGVMASYLLIFIFKDFKGNARLFLLIAILLLLYAGGKLLHLSPLLIILIFGLALSNHQKFFKIFRNYLSDHDPVEEIEKEFHLITLETAFVVRTLFFVIFGMTIKLSSLANLNVLGISIAVLVALYAVRFISLRAVSSQHLTPEIFLAPRGLITILLFFAIPAKHQFSGFDSGILLYVIIISSLIMTWALIKDGKKQKTQSSK